MMTVQVRFYTDPACPWSWAAEPALRRLMWEFEGELEFAWVMGGLARRYGREYRDEEGRIGTGPDCFADLISHWLEVAAEGRMPTDPRVWTESPLTSTYPACQAVKAAAEQGWEAGYRYLRAPARGDHVRAPQARSRRCPDRRRGGRPGSTALASRSTSSRTRSPRPSAPTWTRSETRPRRPGRLGPSAARRATSGSASPRRSSSGRAVPGTASGAPPAPIPPSGTRPWRPARDRSTRARLDPSRRSGGSAAAPPGSWRSSPRSRFPCSRPSSGRWPATGSSGQFGR